MSNETNIHRNARKIQKYTNLTYQQARQLLVDVGGRQDLSTTGAIRAFVEAAQAADAEPDVEDTADHGGYISLEDCIADGIHLVDCDDDGYCNHCGEMDNLDADLDDEDADRASRSDLCDVCRPSEHPSCSLAVGCACCDTTIAALADERHAEASSSVATVSAADAKRALAAIGWTPAADRLDAVEIVHERLCDLTAHSDYAVGEDDFERIDAATDAIVDNLIANWDSI